MNKQFDSIDVAKLIASILIFAMHCNALGAAGPWHLALQLCARWGVPFFFLSSSYFLFSKEKDGNINEEPVKRYISRVFHLYLVWFVYNIPNVVYNNFYGRDLFSMSTWFTIIKNWMLSSSFSGSWFLVSSMFSAWIVYLLGKKYSTGKILLFTFVPYLLCALSSAYYGLIPESMSSVLEFLCFPLNIFNGCFYFAIGKYVCENKEKICNKFTFCSSTIISVIFYSLFIAEILFAKRASVLESTDCGLFLAPAAVFLFISCLKIKKEFPNHLLYRKLSTVIYCCQGNILSIRGFCATVLGVQNSALLFIFASVLVAVVCLMVLYLQKHTNWKWVKYLT